MNSRGGIESMFGIGTAGGKNWNHGMLEYDGVLLFSGVMGKCWKDGGLKW